MLIGRHRQRAVKRSPSTRGADLDAFQRVAFRIGHETLHRPRPTLLRLLLIYHAPFDLQVALDRLELIKTQCTVKDHDLGDVSSQSLTIRCRRPEQADSAESGAVALLDRKKLSGVSRGLAESWPPDHPIGQFPFLAFASETGDQTLPRGSGGLRRLRDQQRPSGGPVPDGDLPPADCPCPCHGSRVCL